MTLSQSEQTLAWILFSSSMFVWKYSSGFIRLISNRSRRNSSTNIKLSEDQIITLFDQIQKHNKKAAKLPLFQEVKSLVHVSNGYGVISTNSVYNSGYPNSSLAGYQIDESGKPFFVFSKLSHHTRDLIKNNKASILIFANKFSNAADGRVTLIGDVNKIEDNELSNILKQKYLQKHKDAYWVNFGDFSCYQMEDIKSIRYVGGFGKAVNIEVKDYLKALPDALFGKVDAEINYFNEFRSELLLDLFQTNFGISLSKGKLLSIDSYGISVNYIYFDGENEDSIEVRYAFKNSVLNILELQNILGSGHLDEFLLK